MSLYGDLLPTTPGTSSPITPTPPTTVNTSGPASSTTSSSSAPATVKPAFAFPGAPRALTTARPLTLTPAQRALQIAAAAQRSAAILAAKEAQATTTTASSTVTGSTAVSTSTPLTGVTNENTTSPLAPSKPSSLPSTTIIASSTADSSSMDDDGDDGGPLSAPIPNEYDPRCPNEYEDYVKHRDQRRREEQEQLELERERKEYEREHERDRSRSSGGHGRDRDRNRDRERERERDAMEDVEAARPSFLAATSSYATPANSTPSTSSSSTPISTGPKLDLKVSSGEEAFLRRQMMSRGGVPPPSSQPSIKTPLQPFVSASTPSQPPPSDSDSNTANKRARVDPAGGSDSTAAGATPPSRVLLLLNMVARGDVDEELESETADECSRFGRVLKCTVFECPPGTNARDDEAVRIFVKFDTVEAAQKALTELNGRYFGGRRVVARFVDESGFNKGKLAP